MRLQTGHPVTCIAPHPCQGHSNTLQMRSGSMHYATPPLHLHSCKHSDHPHDGYICSRRLHCREQRVWCAIACTVLQRSAPGQLKQCLIRVSISQVMAMAVRSGRSAALLAQLFPMAHLSETCMRSAIGYVALPMLAKDLLHDLPSDTCYLWCY